MSTSGKAAMVFSVPSAVLLSAARGRNRASGRLWLSWAMAEETVPSLRPLMMTRAPSAASVSAMARPMPPEEAVTRASLLWS